VSYRAKNASKEWVSYTKKKKEEIVGREIVRHLNKKHIVKFGLSWRGCCGKLRALAISDHHTPGVLIVEFLPVFRIWYIVKLTFCA